MNRDRDTQKKFGKKLHIGMSVYALIFSVVWCILAATSGAGFMVIFGLGFVALTGYRLYAVLKLSKEQRKETDPWDQPQNSRGYTTEPQTGNGFCPYCGEKTEGSFSFCPKCGRKLQ